MDEYEHSIAADKKKLLRKLRKTNAWVIVSWTIAALLCGAQ